MIDLTMSQDQYLLHHPHHQIPLSHNFILQVLPKLFQLNFVGRHLISSHPNFTFRYPIRYRWEYYCHLHQTFHHLILFCCHFWLLHPSVQMLIFRSFPLASFRSSIKGFEELQFLECILEFEHSVAFRSKNLDWWWLCST